MSSADVKTFLEAQFPDTQSKDWKRTARQKTEGGVVRTFQHPTHGQVVVEEDAQGQLSVTGTKENTSEFVGHPFTVDQVAAARKLLHAYNRMARSHRNDPMEELMKHEAYPAGGKALGTQLAFYFPNQTYGNEEAQIRSLDDPIGDACVMVFDPTPGSDLDLYASTLVHDTLEALGLSAEDEYHYECRDKGRSTRQFVQDLLSLGLRYLPHHADNEENCLLDALLVPAGALTPRTPTSPTARPKPYRSEKNKLSN